MEHSLFSIWQTLASGYTKDADLISQFWKELEMVYTAKFRHYHTLQHLASMLHLAEQYQPQIAAPALLQFAVFYHDVVYSTSSSDNEEKSAQLALNRLQALGVSAQESQTVSDMILATKHHHTHPNPDVNLLLDFDLYILGAPWPEYQQYSQQIRKEYRIYPDFLYKPGRKKVLKHFLERDTLYQTQDFQQEREATARENLERELNLL